MQRPPSSQSRSHGRADYGDSDSSYGILPQAQHSPPPLRKERGAWMDTSSGAATPHVMRYDLRHMAYAGVVASIGTLLSPRHNREIWIQLVVLLVIGVLAAVFVLETDSQESLTESGPHWYLHLDDLADSMTTTLIFLEVGQQVLCCAVLYV